MSKVVSIPTYMKPDWVCTINGKKYSYPAGSRGTVPDEVAELIENINAGEPVPVPPIPEGKWRADVPDGKYIAKVENGVAEYFDNSPIVFDFTSLAPEDIGTPINLTDRGAITVDEYLEATNSGRDIYIKLLGSTGTGMLLVDHRSVDNTKLFTTKLYTGNSQGLTLINLFMWVEDESVYGQALIGFAANPYAGGGE